MSNEVNPTMLEQIEQQLEGMKLKCYPDAFTLPHAALDLAVTSVKVARFAIEHKEALCKLYVPSLDGATHQLIEALYPLPIDEPQQDLPLPAAVPEWLEAA